MRNFSLLTLTTIFFSIAGLSEAATLSSDGLTTERIESFHNQVHNKIKNVPEDQITLITEQNWVIGELSSIRGLLDDFSDKGTNKDYKKLRIDVQSYFSNFSKLDCANEGVAKNQIREWQTDWSPIRSNIFFSTYDRTSEWSAIERIRVGLSDYIGKDSESLDLETCESIKEKLTSPSTVETINAFFNYVDKEEELIQSKKQESKTKLQSLEKSLIEYNSLISKSLEESRKRNTLEDNLYLMILVIGSLSILAIFVVRWFPESVMQEWVESGQVIQFVTVMLLLSVIMTLGLAGLLTENTLGTLLGGIGGYVLSQGVGRAAARNAIKQTKDRS